MEYVNNNNNNNKLIIEFSWREMCFVRFPLLFIVFIYTLSNIR